MNYIDSSILIEEVVNELHTYFDNSQVEESILYPVIRECLTQMGANILEEVEGTLAIKNFRGDFPKGFKSLTEAYLCSNHEVTRRIPNTGIHTVEVGVVEVDPCAPFELQKDGCGNTYKIVQHLPYETYSWSTIDILTTYNTSCSKDCPNVGAQSPFQITINNNSVTTSFESGTIYIKYLKTPETDTGYNIPDHDTIIAWVKYEMQRKVLENLYVNGTPDLERRLQFVEQKCHIAKENARKVWKSSSLQQFYGVRNTLAKRYIARAKGIL